MAEHVLPELSESEVQALNKFPINSFSDFLLLVFDLLISSKKSEEIVLNIEKFSVEISANVGGIKNLVNSLIRFLQDATKQSFTPAILNKRLLRYGLSAEKSSMFVTLWKEKFPMLCRAIGQMFMINQLVDMEWKFGVTAATSENVQVGQSFIQLKLLINKGNYKDAISMELSLPQFYSFLHEMEKAKTNLELLS